MAKNSATVGPSVSRTAACAPSMESVFVAALQVGGGDQQHRQVDRAGDQHRQADVDPGDPQQPACAAGPLRGGRAGRGPGRSAGRRRAASPSRRASRWPAARSRRRRSAAPVPPATAPSGGGSTNRLVRNPIAMTSSRPVITRSNVRWPRRFCTASSSSDTAPVITPPTSSGRSNSRCSAMAPPTTSARSVAMATSSACSQYAIRVGVRRAVGDGFGQGAAGDQAELGRQVLHEPRHRVGQRR